MKRNPNRSSTRSGCHKWQRLGLVLAMTLSAAAQQSPDAPVHPDPRQNSVDPLTELNAAFRAAYAESRRQVIRECGSVIIHSGDAMVLIKDGVRTEAATVTASYHELKSVAHVPLALYVMLSAGAESKMDDSQLGALRAYRSLVVKGRDSIQERSLTPNQRERQLRIFDRSLDLIDASLRDGRTTREELRRFTRSQREDILANAYEAAEDQIETMDRQVKAWLAAMTDDERKRLRVAVSSVHMARVGNLAMQYFSATLGEPFEGRFEEEEFHNSDFRLVCTESVFDEPEILKALGTHVLDEAIGIAFFDDGQRMHRDLLADPTEEIIRKKFGRRSSAATKQ